MAGKQEWKRESGKPSAAEKETSWRKQVDDDLKRFHSLLFGAEAAAEKRDFSAAHILGLRLLGFLDSHSVSNLDHAFVRPIRRQALSNLDSARRSLVPDSDRYVSLSLSLSLSLS